MEKLLTPAQVADRLAVSLRMVYRLAEMGDLASVKLGRLLRFREHDVEKFVESSRREAG